jgi:hypothetical protein
VQVVSQTEGVFVVYNDELVTNRQGKVIVPLMFQHDITKFTVQIKVMDSSFFHDIYIANNTKSSSNSWIDVQVARGYARATVRSFHTLNQEHELSIIYFCNEELEAGETKVTVDQKAEFELHIPERMNGSCRIVISSSNLDTRGTLLTIF